MSKSNTKLKIIRIWLIAAISAVAGIYALSFGTMIIQLAFHQFEAPVVGMMTYDIVSPDEDSLVTSLEKLRDTNPKFSHYYQDGKIKEVLSFHSDTPDSVKYYISPKGIPYGSWSYSSEGVGLGSKRNHIIEIVVPSNTTPTTFYVSRALNGQPTQISFSWYEFSDMHDNLDYIKNVNKFLDSVCKYDKQIGRNIFYCLPHYISHAWWEEAYYIELFLILALILLKLASKDETKK